MFGVYSHSRFRIPTAHLCCNGTCHICVRGAETTARMRMHVCTCICVYINASIYVRCVACVAQNTVALCTGVLIGFITSWRLALVIIGAVPPMALSGMMMMKLLTCMYSIFFLQPVASLLVPGCTSFPCSFVCLQSYSFVVHPLPAIKQYCRHVVC